MAGNARFHNKWHRKAHHSIASEGYPDSATDPIASASEPFKGEFVLQDTLSALGDATFANDIYVFGNTTVFGNLTALGETTRIDTLVTTTSALSVFNNGTFPALTVKQTSVDNPVARFIAEDGAALVIEGKGNIGINTGVIDPFIGVSINTTLSSAYPLSATAVDGLFHSFEGSVSEGSSKATGTNSHAEGVSCLAQSTGSHAEGSQTVSHGIASHAEGSGTQATEDASHAEGSNTTASGVASHAEGVSNTASGNASHAQGSFNQAIGDSSSAQGSYNVVRGAAGTAIGVNNVIETSAEGGVAIGKENLVIGKHSTAIGSNAKVGHEQAFVFASNDKNDFQSNSVGDHTFNVFASGGIHLFDSVTIGDPASATFFVITTAGYMGIHTDDPTEALTVGGNLSARGCLSAFAPAGMYNRFGGGSMFDSISAKSPNYETLVVRGVSAISTDTSYNILRGTFGINTIPLSTFALHVKGGNVRIDGVDYSARPGFNGITYDTDGQSLFDLRSGSPDANYCLSIASSGLGNFMKFFGGRRNDSQAFIAVRKNQPLRFVTFDDFFGTNFTEICRVGANGNFSIGTGTGGIDREGPEKLSVCGGISGSGNLFIDGNVILGLNNTRTVTVRSGPVSLVNATNALDALEFGQGATSANLYTPLSDTLRTDDSFVVDRTLTVNRDSTLGTANTAINVIRGTVRIADSSQSRGINFSSDNITYDTNLYRSAADTLRTDDNLIVDLSLSVNGNTTLGNATTDTNTLRGVVRIADSSQTNGINFSSDNATYDTNLYRSAADTLRTDDNLIVNLALSVNGASNLGDAVSDVTTIRGVLNIGDSSSTTGIQFGNNNTNYDTNLYRSASDTLKTDDNFVVQQGFSVNGNSTLGDASTDTNTLRGVVRIADSSQTNGINFSSNNSVYDVNLYRSAADTLKTDDNFVVGSLAVGTNNSVVIHNAGKLEQRNINPIVWGTSTPLLSGQNTTANKILKALDSNNTTTINSSLEDNGTEVYSSARLTVQGSLSSSQGITAANIELKGASVISPTTITDSGEVLLLNINGATRAIRLWSYTV